MWTLAVVLAVGVVAPPDALASTPRSGRLTAGNHQPQGVHPGVRMLEADAELRAVATALELVPARAKYEVVILDPDLAPDARAIRQLDAFTVREPDGRLRPKVYLNRESPLLKEAARGVDLYVKVLAAVIVHEIAHLDGGAEPAAKEAERRFFAELIARGLVARHDGMRYLSLMREH